MNPFFPTAPSGSPAAAAAGTRHPGTDQDLTHLRSTSTGFELVRDPTQSHSSSSSDNMHSSSPAGTDSRDSASPAFGHTSSSAHTQSTATTSLTRSYTGSSADTVTPGGVRDARQEQFEMARTDVDHEDHEQELPSPWLSSSVGTIAAVGVSPPGLATQKSSSSVIRPAESGGMNVREMTIETTAIPHDVQGPHSLSTVSNLGSIDDRPTLSSSSSSPVSPPAIPPSSHFPTGPAPPLPPRPSASKLSPVHDTDAPPSLPGDKLRRNTRERDERDDGAAEDPHSPAHLLEDNCTLLWQLRRVHRMVKQADKLADELAWLSVEERRVDRKLADVSHMHAQMLRRVLGQEHHPWRGMAGGEHGGRRQHGHHHPHHRYQAGQSGAYPLQQSSSSYGSAAGGLPVRGPIGPRSARMLY